MLQVHKFHIPSSITRIAIEGAVWTARQMRAPKHSYQQNRLHPIVKYQFKREFCWPSSQLALRTESQQLRVALINS
jgi:hypothetical protein